MDRTTNTHGKTNEKCRLIHLVIITQQGFLSISLAFRVHHTKVEALLRGRAVSARFKHTTFNKQQSLALCSIELVVILCVCVFFASFFEKKNLPLHSLVHLTHSHRLIHSWLSLSFNKY